MYLYGEGLVSCKNLFPIQLYIYIDNKIIIKDGIFTDWTTHTSPSPIRRGFASDFVNYKKGALDSQPQVIKFTSCLPMVGSSKTERHDVNILFNRIFVAVETLNFALIILFVKKYSETFPLYYFIYIKCKLIRLCKLQKRCTRLAAASDKVYQLLAHGR
jgi:hypothetical protein